MKYLRPSNAYDLFIDIYYTHCFTWGDTYSNFIEYNESSKHFAITGTILQK